MQHFLRPSLLGLMLIAAGRAQAISIGEIEVRSHLGEPFNALVAVSIDELTLPQVDCFRLVGASRTHPDLANARVFLVSKGDKQYVSIVGSQPANDPILDINLLSEGCGPALRRDFLVLLSPKDPAPNPTVQPPVVMAATTLIEPPPAPPSRKKRPRKTVATSPQYHPPVANRRSTMAYTSRHVLRLDYGFDAFSQAAERIAKEKQQAHLATPNQPPAPVDAARKDVLVLQGSPTEPGSAAGPGATGTPGVEPATQTTPTSPAGPTGGNMDKPGSAPTSTTQRENVGGLSFREFLTPVNLLLLLLLPLIAIALALWLKSRSRREDYSEVVDTFAADHVDTKVHVTPGPTDTESTDTDTNSPRISGLLTEPITKSALHGDTSGADHDNSTTAKPVPTAEAEPYDSGLLPEYSSVDAFTVETTETPDHVLELAEVMLAFGRSGQAIETLRHYIRSQPKQGVEPWLKLLDLYRQSELREEFDSLSMDLHQCFNVAVPDWDSYPSTRIDADKPLGTSLTLESLPHIMGRLVSIWSQPECLNYLEKLLADNRGGQRQGFALPIVREILMLRDILRVINPSPV